jgi:peroxiredoxin
MANGQRPMAFSNYLYTNSIQIVPINIGDLAPRFSAYTSDKVEIHLNDLRGKNVVLLFFPLAFTSTCTAELCMMRDDLTRYQEMDAEVVGISVDAPQTLAKYKSELQLNFMLVSDFNKEISPAYGAMYDVFSVNLRGVSKRAAFVIDKEGVIRYAEVLENAKHLPNFDAISRTLSELK